MKHTKLHFIQYDCQKSSNWLVTDALMTTHLWSHLCGIIINNPKSKSVMSRISTPAVLNGNRLIHLLYQLSLSSTSSDYILPLIFPSTFVPSILSFPLLCIYTKENKCFKSENDLPFKSQSLTEQYFW